MEGSCFWDFYGGHFRHTCSYNKSEKVHVSFTLFYPTVAFRGSMVSITSGMWTWILSTDLILLLWSCVCVCVCVILCKVITRAGA